MGRAPEEIGRTVKTVLQNLGMDRIIRKHSIWNGWEEIVGREVASHTRPAFYSGRCLFITVDHSTWMHQLNFLKESIIANINRKLGSEAVKEIRFRMGTLPDEDGKPEDRSPVPTRLGRKERKVVEESISMISSKELRETLSRIMVKDLSTKKHGRKPPEG